AIDARSDVYSLGAVLYEMLTGDAPFTGSSVQAIVAKVLTERPTALHTLRDTVPPHLEGAVFTALAKLPADRFASAAEFATALSSTHSTAFVPSVVAATARGPWRDARAWITLLSVALAAGFAALYFARPDASRAVSRQQVLLWQGSLPEVLAPGARLIATQAAIAPDGSSIVFSDSVATGLVL